MLTVLRSMKGPITIDFIEKGATVNRGSYCQFLWQNSLYLLNNPRIINHASILIWVYVNKWKDDTFGDMLNAIFGNGIGDPSSNPKPRC